MVKIVSKNDWFLERKPTSVQMLRSEKLIVGLTRSINFWQRILAVTENGLNVLGDSLKEIYAWYES